MRALIVLVLLLASAVLAADKPQLQRVVGFTDLAAAGAIGSWLKGRRV
ncbi:MAG: hypothetical protein AB7V26_12110 [Lysobacterales bacterium]